MKNLKWQDEFTLEQAALTAVGLDKFNSFENLENKILDLKEELNLGYDSYRSNILETNGDILNSLMLLPDAYSEFIKLEMRKSTLISGLTEAEEIYHWLGKRLSDSDACEVFTEKTLRMFWTLIVVSFTGRFFLK